MFRVDCTCVDEPCANIFLLRGVDGREGDVGGLSRLSLPRDVASGACVYLYGWGQCMVTFPTFYAPMKEWRPLRAALHLSVLRGCRCDCRGNERKRGTRAKKNSNALMSVKPANGEYPTPSRAPRCLFASVFSAWSTAPPSPSPSSVDDDAPMLFDSVAVLV